jgi:hypothetical protein
MLTPWLENAYALAVFRQNGRSRRGIAEWPASWSVIDVRSRLVALPAGSRKRFIDEEGWAVKELTARVTPDGVAR